MRLHQQHPPPFSLRIAELEIKSLRKRLKIKVLGDECPDPLVTWEEFYDK